MLDGKQITDNSRQFLMSWKASREAQQIREKSKPDLLESGIDNLNNVGKLKNIDFKTMNMMNKNKNRVYIYIISFYFSPKYSFHYRTCAFNDIVPSIRSVHLLLYRLYNAIPPLLSM
jgi:hypothetical protein